MINQEKVLWRQLNGPQITAIENSLWDFQIKKYDAVLDYLNRLSIETANSEHLDFIGRLMRIPRAVIITNKYFDDLLLFSAEHESDLYNAFSGYSNGEWVNAGPFGFDFESKQDAYEPIDDDTYRKVLSALAKYHGHSKSLEFIDFLCSQFLIQQTQDGTVRVSYQIVEDQLIPGDIQIRISNTLGYRQIVLQQLFNQLFSSTPKVTIFSGASYA